MKSLVTAIGFTWWQPLVVAAVVALLSFVACRLQVLLDTNQVTLLFGIKIGIVAIVTSAILFFYRFFWTDIRDMNLNEYPKLVSYYKYPFLWLFTINSGIFISAVLDGYIVFLRYVPIVQYVSHGFFLSAILFLLVLAIFLYIRVFAELQTLRRAGLTTGKK